MGHGMSTVRSLSVGRWSHLERFAARKSARNQQCCEPWWCLLHRMENEKPIQSNDQAAANQDLIRRYLDVATPGSLDPDSILQFLADDVVIEDTLMPSTGAEAFVAALRQVPSGEGMSASVQHVVADDRVAAARVLFTAGDIEVQFSQWFWIEDGKITRIQVIYDPRPFLEATG